MKVESFKVEKFQVAWFKFENLNVKILRMKLLWLKVLRLDILRLKVLGFENSRLKVLWLKGKNAHIENVYIHYGEKQKSCNLSAMKMLVYQTTALVYCEKTPVYLVIAPGY